MSALHLIDAQSLTEGHNVLSVQQNHTSENVVINVEVSAVSEFFVFLLFNFIKLLRQQTATKSEVSVDCISSRASFCYCLIQYDYIFWIHL